MTAKGYRERNKETDGDGPEASRLDILQTTDQMIEIASKIPLTNVIDPLDERRFGQRHELLGALDMLLARSAHLIKVLVSSRDDVDIFLRLQKHPNIYINMDDNKDDIHRFVQYDIQKAQSDRRLLKGIFFEELMTLVTESLADKAGGIYVVFLILHTHKGNKIQVSLNEHIDREPVRQSPYQN